VIFNVKMSYLKNILLIIIVVFVERMRALPNFLCCYCYFFSEKVGSRFPKRYPPRSILTSLTLCELCRYSDRFCSYRRHHFDERVLFLISQATYFLSFFSHFTLLVSHFTAFQLMLSPCLIFRVFLVFPNPVC